MEVIHQEKGTVDVFHISGRLDYTASASDFESRLRSPWERDPLRRFPVLDLSGVTMLSSQALRAVLALAKDLKGQAGIVYVSAPSTAAREALKVSGFLQLKIFELHDTLTSAIEAATLAASTAPALKTDDPWKVAPAPPPPPPPPTGLKAVWHATKNSASMLAKAWQSAAMLIQSVLDGKKK
jgi:anti-anti-sigma factor